MGGLCTQSTTTLPDPKSVLSGTQIPEWVSSAGRQLYEQSAEMAGSPFPGYTGQRMATYGNLLDPQGNQIQVEPGKFKNISDLNYKSLKNLALGFI